MQGSFEDKLRQADKTFVLKPSDGSWNKLSQKMAGRRKFYWIWLIPFFALFGGTVLWLMQSIETNDTKNNTGLLYSLKENAISPLPETNSVKPELNSTIPKSNLQNTPSPEPVSAKTPDRQEFNSDAFLIESTEDTTPTFEQMKFDLWPMLSRSVSFGIVPVQWKFNPIPVLLPTSFMAKEPVTLPMVYSKWELGILLNAGKSGLKDMSKSKSALTASLSSVNAENPKTQNMTVFGLGVKINYYAKPWFFISSGIGFQQMGVIYEVSKINNPASDTVLYKSKPVNSPDIDIYRNQINYLEFPVLAGVSLNKGKTVLQISSGFAMRYAISGNFLQRYKAERNPDMYDFVSPEWGAMQREQITWSSGLTVGYALNQKSMLKIETGYNVHLSKLLNYSEKKFRDVSLGLGYSFKF
jgi:hypothetical protein